MDLEMHIVHLTPDGGLGAVLGIFFDRFEGGEGENLFIKEFDPLWGYSDVNASLNMQGFVQSLNLDDFWSYSGSLTTPPCTEGVKWSVLKQVQPISGTQLKHFTDLWAGDANFSAGRGNNRLIQPLNGRTVYWSDFHTTALAMITGWAIACGVLVIILGGALSIFGGIMCCCPNRIGLKKVEK